MDREREIKAKLREDDLACRLPTSAESRNDVIRLRALPPANQAFCFAVYAEYDLPNLLRCALDAGISADCTYRGEPALCLAARNGSARALKILLDRGASHALTDFRGMTASHHAALYGQTGCLSVLLDAGSRLEASAIGFLTPLHCAAGQGHLGCCSLLLSAGSDGNARDALGLTPIMMAIANKHTPCVRLLVPASDVSVKNSKGRTVVHFCIIDGNLECFELLLPLISGVDIDQRSAAGYEPDGSPTMAADETPLHFACSFGQRSIAKLLLSHGASRTASDSEHRTPLHEAAASGHVGCVALLLGKPGAYKLTPEEVNATASGGQTPLHFAASHGHGNVCGTLIAAGARLDAVDALGYTPLMLCRQEHPANTAMLDLLSGRGPAQPPGTVCDGCGVPETEASLRACNGCLVARFCGNACLRAAWPAHKAECKRAQAAREERCKGSVSLTIRV